MRTLYIPQPVFVRIVRSVSSGPRGCETGVTLFGTSLERGCDVVLAVAGPGRNATYEPAHYSGDEAHASEMYHSLRCAMPGIRWVGEFHVHPRGMTWLSQGDRETVRQILTGTDDTLHPDSFIAGVMQRRNGTVDIYPFHFTRESLKGLAMGLRVVDTHSPEVEEARRNVIEERKHDDRFDLHAESEGSRTPVREAPRNRWLRQWWERLGRYCRKGGHRQADAH